MLWITQGKKGKNIEKQEKEHKDKHGRRQTWRRTNKTEVNQGHTATLYRSNTGENKDKLRFTY